MRIENLNFKL